MSNAETIYSARVAYPDLIERARTQTLQLDTYRDGARAAPSSGTVSVYDDSNTAIVDAAAVVVSGSAATYSLTAATIPDTLDLSTGWREEWALVMPDGVTHTFRRDAWLVLRMVHPPITNDDLTDEYDDLGDLVSTPTTQYQTKIDASWKLILSRLAEQGILPTRIVTPWSLREVLLDLTLSKIFRYFHSSVGEGKYLELSAEHREDFERKWKTLQFGYDETGQGYDGDHTSKTPGVPVLYTNAPPTSVRSGGW